MRSTTRCREEKRRRDRAQPEHEDFETVNVFAAEHVCDATEYCRSNRGRDQRRSAQQRSFKRTEVPERPSNLMTTPMMNKS